VHRLVLLQYNAVVGFKKTHNDVVYQSGSLSTDQISMLELVIADMAIT
jgi:hypothetical protein